MPAHPKSEVEHPDPWLRSPVQDPEVRVRVLRTIADVETVREIWERLQAHPETDFDLFMTHLRTHADVAEPLVMALYVGDKCRSLLAGRIEDSLLCVSSGYRVFWRAGVRRLQLSCAAFMGQTDERTTECVIGHLLRVLRTERIDLLVWHGVRWASPLKALLQTKPSFWCRDFLARATTHWVMRLPSSLDELFKKQLPKKKRNWAKCRIKFLERDFPGQVQYMPLSTPETLPKLFHDVAVVARRSYQCRLGVGFQGAAEQRDSIALLAEKGMLRAMVLYVKQRPVSYWICTQYGRGLYLEYTGYDPSFRRYEPGTLGLFWITDQACREGLEFIDMGGGPWEYKRKFSNSQFLEGQVLVFASSRRGVLLNALRLLTLGPIELIRRGAELCGIEAQVKEMWRRYPAQVDRRHNARQMPKVNNKWIASKTPRPIPPGAGQQLSRLAFVALLLAVTYLSWKPSPSMSQVPWIPATLAGWFDQHDFSKNLIGFGIFGLTGFLAWAWPTRRPVTNLSGAAKRSIMLLACFCAFVAILELGQLALPRRTCDWADILAGWTGIVLAWAVFQLAHFIFAERDAQDPANPAVL